jgi:hypothetical protein
MHGILIATYIYHGSVCAFEKASRAENFALQPLQFHNVGARRKFQRGTA